MKYLIIYCLILTFSFNQLYSQINSKNLKNAVSTSNVDIEIIILKVFKDKSTYLVFKNQKLIEIKSNAGNDVLKLNYNKINDILTIMPLEDLSDYEHSGELDLLTNKNNRYHIILNYDLKYTKKKVLSAKSLKFKDNSKLIYKTNTKQKKINKEKKVFTDILVLNNKNKKHNTKGVNNSIQFNLNNIINFKNVFYVFTEVENNSNIDYELENLKIKRNYLKTQKQQNPEIEDIIPYKVVDEDFFNYTNLLINTNQYLVNVNSSKHFIVPLRHKKQLIFIFDKLTILKNEKIVITLFEKDGIRELIMGLENYLVNDPSYMKYNPKIDRYTLIKGASEALIIKEKERNIFLDIGIPSLPDYGFQIALGYWRRIKVSHFAYYGKFLYLKNTLDYNNNRVKNDFIVFDFGGGYRKSIVKNLDFNSSLGFNFGYHFLDLKKANSFITGFSLLLDFEYKISSKLNLGLGYNFLFLNTRRKIFNENVTYFSPVLKISFVFGKRKS